MIIEKTVNAVIEKEGRILLMKRANTPFRGMWCIPGGHIERGETPYQAAMRETSEEVGKVQLEKKPFIIYIHHVRVGHIHKAHSFHGRPVGRIRVSREAKKIGWFTLDQIARMNVTSYSLVPINKLYPKVGYDDYGRKVAKTAEP